MSFVRSAPFARLALAAALGLAGLGGCARTTAVGTGTPDAATACSDGERSPGETDIDCGGGCGPCVNGKGCGADADCLSGLCLGGRCTVLSSSCLDGERNGDETDVDCGGLKCRPCGESMVCVVGADCASGVCSHAICQPPSCTDTVKNGDESDADCGGGCAACASGRGCHAAGDCASGVCQGGACLPAECADGVDNGDETDIDCGGPCTRCAAGLACGGSNDCVSGVCAGGRCQEASCSDGTRNGRETDTDCGGGVCGRCTVGKVCRGTADCDGGLCVRGQCAAASCQDGLRNGDETDIDCGGSCPLCAPGMGCGSGADCESRVCSASFCAPASCGDGVKNGSESDVDCGASCTRCVDGKACGAGADCASLSCLGGACFAPACNDTVRNGGETDVDCGGPLCKACDVGKACAAGSDCGSGVCEAGACAAATCVDGVRNGLETDVDCGGAGGCAACADNAACKVGADCASGACTGGFCSAPSCHDGVRNGGETDVDCGSSCTPCADGRACGGGGDCLSRRCFGGHCATANCDDGILNGDESDVDCGGARCSRCADLKGCRAAGDCNSSVCTNDVCQAPRCDDRVRNGGETDVDCGGAGGCPACGVQSGCARNADCWNNDCQQGACTAKARIGVGVGEPAAFDPGGDGSKLVVVDGNGNVTVDRASSLLAIARYIWVSNSGEGTVSKIDPNQKKEVARYCTAPGCNADPSRASVSLDGDAGIANRANYFYGGTTHADRASAVKIAGDLSRCIDRNGNGQIDTNTQAGLVPAQFVWQSGQADSPDECVLWFTRLNKDRSGVQTGGAGTLPRSATFDSKASQNGNLSSNFFVGLYGSRELVQLDAATGVIKKQIDVGGAPYSSVFDRHGYLWIRDASSNKLIRVDTNDANLAHQFVGPAIPCGYAISADKRGYIYGAGSNCVARLDPSQQTPAWESLALPGACFTRGPSVDADFNLWVPDTCYGAYHVDASKVFGQGMVLKKAIPLTANSSAYFLGTAIDGNSYPWIVNTETGSLQQQSGPSGTVYRIDAANNYAVSQVRVGATPYVYSDLSGSQLALTAPTTGSYRKTFKAWCGDKASWGKLTWTDQVPAQTTIQVRYRGGKDAFAVSVAPFVDLGLEPPAIAQPVQIALPQGTDPSLLQVEFIISTSDTNNKPTLGSVAVDYTCPVP